MTEEYINNGSFWFDSLPEVKVPDVPTLPDAVDVAIIGAGFTGLWTAYYLSQQKPDLSIAIFEANTIGFGASGRNGGWCMGWAMGIEQLLARKSTRSAGLTMARAMQQTVDEIHQVTNKEQIDCHFDKGGELTVATTPFHARYLKMVPSERRQVGFSDEDFAWLSPEESRARVNMKPNFGALFTPHCAAIHPLRLVRGLSECVISRGVKIYERTPVLGYESKRLKTANGNVKASVILRATEGYTDSIKGQARQMLPLYSMMVATEPLPDTLWEEIGLLNRETFGDARRIVIYGQKTRDGRLAFGGRAGYYFGSRLKPVILSDDAHLDHVEKTLRDLFPMLAPFEVTHRWGGLMGVPRHWRPFVAFDKGSGLGKAGGYTGEGVGASNLAGRILADLVAECDSELVRLPWVDDVARKWEVEPFRWLGAGSIQWFGDRADKVELQTGKPSKLWGGLFDRFVG